MPFDAIDIPASAIHGQATSNKQLLNSGLTHYQNIMFTNDFYH
jgi:hypothetical protein